jgi:hypothetical protein
MKFSVSVHHGEGDESVALSGALCNAQNEPGFILKPEYARIEYAFNDELRAAWPHVPGSDDRVLWKTLCHLVD